MTTVHTTFITSLIKIYDDNEDPKPIQKRIDCFNQLVQSGIPICLFISYELLHLVLPILHNSKNVRLMQLCDIDDLEFNEIYKKYPSTPTNINIKKDTHKYMACINSKIEFVKKVMDKNPFNTTQFAYIDFNLYHIITDVPRISNLLKHISENLIQSDKVLIPGCYSKTQIDNKSDDEMINNVQWRFCGGFFIGCRQAIEDMYQLTRNHIEDIFKICNRITWEVNVWAFLEKRFNLKAQWLKSNHNNEIIECVAEYFQKPMRSLNGLESSKTGTYELISIKGCTPSTISYVEHLGKKYMNVRYVNYIINPNGSYTIYHPNEYLETQNIMYRLDDDYQIMGYGHLLDDSTIGLPKYNREIQGIEDMRLYCHNGQMKFVATQREYSASGRNRMMVGVIDTTTYSYKDCAVIEPPTDTGCEKNWLPINYYGYEAFIYSWCPMQIGIIINNKLTIIKCIDMPSTFHNIRGSSTFIQSPYNENDIMAVVHYSKDPAPRRYYHRIVVLDKKTLQLKEYSDDFVFCKESIEFCIGFAYKDGNFYFWFSQFDRNPMWLSVRGLKEAIAFNSV